MKYRVVSDIIENKLAAEWIIEQLEREGWNKEWFTIMEIG